VKGFSEGFLIAEAPSGKCCGRVLMMTWARRRTHRPAHVRRTCARDGLFGYFSFEPPATKE